MRRLICIFIGIIALSAYAFGKKNNNNPIGEVVQEKIKIGNINYQFEIFSFDFDFDNLDNNANDIVKYYIVEAIEEIGEFDWYVTETRGGNWPSYGPSCPRFSFFQKVDKGFKVYCLDLKHSYDLSYDEMDEIAYAFLQKMSKPGELIASDDSFLDDDEKLLSKMSQLTVVSALTPKTGHILLKNELKK